MYGDTPARSRKTSRPANLMEWVREQERAERVRRRNALLTRAAIGAVLLGVAAAGIAAGVIVIADVQQLEFAAAGGNECQRCIHEINGYCVNPHVTKQHGGHVTHVALAAGHMGARGPNRL